jgi:hypothetical protein
MQRYHELQQEFVDQQLALAPVVIPDNQVGPCAACWHGTAVVAGDMCPECGSAASRGPVVKTDNQVGPCAACWYVVCTVVTLATGRIDVFCLVVASCKQ